jgi:DNA modification methylase
MPSLPDRCAQLVIADPPYNLGKKFGTGPRWTSVEAWLPWCRSWLREIVRLLDPEGNVFVFGIHHYLCYIQCCLYELQLHYRRQIIWHYENGWAGYTRNLAAHYEPILWFSRGPRYTYHPLREPYKSTERLKHKIIKNGKVWTPHPDGRLAGDVWKFPTLAGRRFRAEKVDHPTQKPLALANRIVKHFSNEGDLVLVPFAGSGTECVSAKALGRHFWAAELEPTYAALARRRVAAVSSAEGLLGAGKTPLPDVVTERRDRALDRLR